MKKTTYKDAGVDIDAGNDAKHRIKKLVKATYTQAVMSDIGGFASLIDLKEIAHKYQHPVLVQSIDGVGTKTIIATLMNKFDTLGDDLLSATCNDILVMGAKPLTLLDYIASDRLNPDIIEQLVTGMVKACQENGVALVGGETAEMPNIYNHGEHDLVGIVTGVVEKERIVNGSTIQPGDKIIGLTSSGLHTNGYSLARKLFFDIAKKNVNSIIPELSTQYTLGEILLEPHINYTQPILTLLDAGVNIKGMAHITGGGLLENIPRVLPPSCTAQIHCDSWHQPMVFNIMQEIGQLPQLEMYRTFNMGIGYVLIVNEEDVSTILQKMQKYDHAFQAITIGEIIRGENKVSLL